MNSFGLLVMTKIISISGKGGVGKTTVAALMLKILVDYGKYEILAVDADPDTNLPDVLNIKVNKTIGEVATKLKRDIERGSLPYGVSKRDLLEAWVYSTLIETDSFDLLVMGRTEGEGCYCYVNNVLTGILDTIVSNYDIIIMDMEAGLEHLSRRMDKNVDIMLVVTDPSKMGFETARRIKELIKEVHIEIKDIYIVGNRFSYELKNKFIDLSHSIGIKPAGIIPEDPYIYEYNLNGKSLFDIPDDSKALMAVKEIVNKIGLIT